VAEEKDDAATKKGMDPLKAYCLVLGFLVLVLGYLWIRIGGTRDDYAAANERAEQFLTGKGLTRRAEDPPPSIPDLAYEVEKYVETYKAAAGESGGNVTPGIPLEMMRNYATSLGMKEVHTGSGGVDVDKGAGHETRSTDFEYDATTLNRLLALVFNVEHKGRYRVSDISWRLGDPNKENSSPPYWFIARPKIKVAVRTPIQRDRE
jgi:hypothetical protein